MPSQFKRCKTCGRIFEASIGQSECPNCVDQREWDYERVKDYLYDHQGAPMTQVCEDTGVDIKVITRFLKEGRIELDSADGFLTCEKCGAPITSGTMCENCKTALSKAMDSVLPQSLLDKRDGREQQALPSRRDDKLHVRKR